MLAVNVKGYAFGMKHVFDALKARGGGSIVNLSSVTGFVAMKAVVPYCTTKGAIIVSGVEWSGHGSVASCRRACACWHAVAYPTVWWRGVYAGGVCAAGVVCGVRGACVQVAAVVVAGWVACVGG